MGLLDDDVQQEPTYAEKIATHLKLSTKNTFDTMVNNFNTGSILFWKHDHATPSEIAAALGSDAKEIFLLHYALSQFISSIKPEAINHGLSVIGNFVMNNDGTVTIIE